jgi:hypothetical protein
MWLVTSIKQSPVLRGHCFLCPKGDLLIQFWLYIRIFLEMCMYLLLILIMVCYIFQQSKLSSTQKKFTAHSHNQCNCPLRRYKIRIDCACKKMWMFYPGGKAWQSSPHLIRQWKSDLIREVTSLRRNLLLIHTTSVTVRYEGIRLDYIKTFSHPFVYFRYILPILFEGATVIVW